MGRPSLGKQISRYYQDVIALPLSDSIQMARDGVPA